MLNLLIIISLITSFIVALLVLKFSNKNFGNRVLALSLLLLVVFFNYTYYHYNSGESYTNFSGLTDNMGPYSNLTLGLDTPNTSSYLHCQNKLPDKNSSAETDLCMTGSHSLDGNSKVHSCQKIDKPSLDGKDYSDKSLAMFSCNYCSPACCPSTFSCSGGCVCTTPTQLSWIQSRGNNH